MPAPTAFRNQAQSLQERYATSPASFLRPEYTNTSTDKDDATLKQIVFRYHLISILSLRSVSHLLHHFPGLSQHEPLSAITSLASHADPLSPWIRPGSDSCTIAADLLKPFSKSIIDSSPKGVDGEEFLLQEVLQKVVQPVFKASKPDSITPAGRKAVNPLPGRVEGIEDAARNREWKGSKGWVMAVLRWVIGHLNVYLNDVLNCKAFHKII